MIPFVNELSFSAAVLAGLVAGVSPCSLPTATLMIGYVGGSRDTTKFRCFLLSLSFVLGLSLTLAIFGILASVLGLALFNLSYLYFFVGILMIIMGLVILDIFPWQFGLGQGTLKTFSGREGMIGAFLLGIPFAFIASPCTIPITTAMLAVAITRADLVFSFWFLFLYALGRSIPLLALGTFTGLLKSLLKKQSLLIGLQKCSAVVLIGLGIFFIVSEML